MARLVKNPLIIGLIAGLLVSVLDWKLPQPVARTVTMFAMASGALSLFVIGGRLVGLPMQGMGRWVLPIALGKLIVHPAVVRLAILALPVSRSAPCCGCCSAVVCERDFYGNTH